MKSPKSALPYTAKQTTTSKSALHKCRGDFERRIKATILLQDGALDLSRFYSQPSCRELLLLASNPLVSAKQCYFASFYANAFLASEVPSDVSHSGPECPELIQFALLAV